jgi:flagellar hook protein FlgE
MSGYGLFAIPTLAMKSEGHALNVIGNNIANVTTGGYKRTDVRFSTVFSESIDQQSDIGGVRPKEFQRISTQGVIQASDRKMDVSINGNGFFVLNTKLDGSGKTLYSRDGSFEMKTENPVSSTDSTGQTSASNTTYEGYLVDKNGYFVQGWSPDATTGLFSSSGTLSPLRIDDATFANSSQTSTAGTLVLNLPASDQVAMPQTDINTIGGTVESGDSYSVTVDGTTVSYTTTASDTTLADVVSGLVAAVNADTTLSGTLTASAGTQPGQVTLTANDIATSFTATTAATNGGGTADNTSSISTTQASGNGTTNIYNIDIIDSNGAHQSTALNFIKSGVNTWDMSWTTSRTPVAQIDTLTLSGTVEAGDKYTATVDGNPVTYTVQSTDTTLADVVSGLVTAINGNGTVAAKVTAAAGTAAGTVTLTATTAGQSFTATAGATNTTTVAQVDTATIAGSVEAGDIYTLTIDGNQVSYTTTGSEGSLAAVRTAFRAAINADSTVSAIITAADGGAAGDITITAGTPGTPFTSSISVTNGGSIADNSASIANTTANAGINDNANSQATTTANVTNTLTSSAQTLTFNGNGTLTSPTSAVSMPLSFASGGTASFSLDISGLTQYAGDFQPTSYTKDGYAAANMRSFSFDSSGQIIATFEDNTFRPIYKLPLAIFSNADMMEMRNGNVFAETTQSGSATYVAADESGQGSFLPQTYEISNVDLNDQFTKLITTQQAYNAAATTFRTLDEMTKTAADLKR